MQLPAIAPVKVARAHAALSKTSQVASDSATDQHAAAAIAHRRVQQQIARAGTAYRSARLRDMNAAVGLLAKPPAAELAPSETSLRPEVMHTRGALSRLWGSVDSRR